jgi:hypothetical protein
MNEVDVLGVMYGRRGRSSSFPLCQTGNGVLDNLSPHYTDDRFRQSCSGFSDGRTVWAADKSKLVSGQYEEATYPGAGYTYSDRLADDSTRSWTAAQQAAEEKYPRRTALFFQEALREFFQDPTIVLVHIVAGVNVGNGYPYLVFGYTQEQTTDEPIKHTNRRSAWT